MYRDSVQGDWFLSEESGSPFIFRISQVQVVAFPPSKVDSELPCVVEFINGKSWDTSKDAGLRLLEAIKLKSML